ncbi:MAG: alkaline phosphatase family protein [Blastocatellia bacterium]|nr:alkaline phosphatase family protein [Blastocatellia bacterium]
MGLRRGRGMRRLAATSGILITVLVAIGGGGTEAAGGDAPTAPGRPKRVIVVSWDGAPDWVIDKMLAEGKLPNVARLVASGVRAEASRPAWPSKTACGHAAIWTGAYSDVNGISGNWVPQLPKAQHTLLEDRSGYHSTGLTAEPLWISAARAGKKVVVLSATHTFQATAIGRRLQRPVFQGTG